MNLGGKTTNPGELRIQITLKRRSVSIETGGFQTPALTTIATVWAKWTNAPCDLLITNEGRCNWTNINQLERELPGTKVVALEKDSFGWLIGGIKYEDKIYSYG